MDWLTWGDGTHKSPPDQALDARKLVLPDFTERDSKPLPLLPILPPCYSMAKSPKSRHEDDVVIKGRQQWAMARSGSEPAQPDAQIQAPFPHFPPFTTDMRPHISQAVQPLASPRFGLGPKHVRTEIGSSERALNEPEIDPVSGLEMRGPQAVCTHNANNPEHEESFVQFFREARDTFESAWMEAGDREPT